MRIGGQTLLRVAAAILVAGVVALAAIEVTRAPDEAAQPTKPAPPSIV
jgi:hypothetical protein